MRAQKYAKIPDVYVLCVCRGCVTGSYKEEQPKPKYIHTETAVSAFQADTGL